MKFWFLSIYQFDLDKELGGTALCFDSKSSIIVLYR